MTGSPSGSTQDPEATKRMLDALAKVDSLRGRVEAFNRLAAFAVGSSADIDAKTSDLLGAEPVRLAMVQVANSLDHLVAWREVLAAEHQPSVAHMTLLRGSMDASVRARWLVDPSLPRPERIARAAAWLREDYRLRRRAEELIKATPKPPAKSAVDRLADVDTEIAALGLPVNVAINLTDMFRAYASAQGDIGELTYAVLSAFAHSRNWSVLLLSMTNVGPGAAPGGAVVLTTANDTLAEAFTVHALDTAELAVADIERSVSP